MKRWSVPRVDGVVVGAVLKDTCWMEMAMNTYFRRGGTLSNIRLDAHR